MVISSQIEYHTTPTSHVLQKTYVHILMRSHYIKWTLIFLILRPRRGCVTKLSLNHEKQFAHHGGKAHYQYVHENQHRWAHGYHAEVLFCSR